MSEFNENDPQRLIEALRDTAYVINQSLNLDEVLQLILRAIEKVVPHDAANIMLVENGIGRIVAVHGYEKIGVDKSVLLNQKREIAAVPNLKRMAETGESIVIPDTSESPDWINFSTSSWIHSYLSTPIRHNQTTIGFINLNSSTRGFYSEHYAERLRAFADQSAIAIENARLYEKAQKELAFRKKVELELQNAMNELENRVEQRTAQLKNMNEQLKLELVRRQKAERELEVERATLSNRVEERTAELSAANAELAKAARLKDAFLANMSHELRTPLNAILNVAETLEEQVYGPLNDRQLQSIRTQEESANHLLSLINDILDLSKIGAGKLELVMDLVPVPALCASSLKLVEEAARKKKIELSLVQDPAVKALYGDLRRLKQVLVNLLSNAVKFTPEGGTVGLAVAGDARNKLVRFMVWDTGIGIPEGEISRLFQPFTQLDNSLSRKFEGTGLGLALAYHIVELHGGGISVSSEEGRGSNFTVTLHWEDGSEYLSPEVGAAAGAAEPDWFESYTNTHQKAQRFLTEFGIEVTNITTDAQSFEEIVEVSPHLIVLTLPDHAESKNLALRLRADPRTKSIPFLAAMPPSQAENPLEGVENVIPLDLASTRHEFRMILKRASVTGTASLVRKAVIVNPGRVSGDGKEKVILLVDDNEVTVRPLFDYLVSRGYRVVPAYCGTEAIERARELKPDIILMDIQMPGMDGIEATRRIRADEKTRSIPVIALTALAMPADRQRCLEAGANGYISKPISLRAVTEMVESRI